MFYRLVSQGVIDKTECEYKNAVGRLLTIMRESNEIPFRWIADSSRIMRKPRSYDSMEDCLNETLKTYRRNFWRNQPHYVEIWCEKEALSGVLYEVTSQFDVPLMISRGFSSISFLHTAAEHISHQNKPAFLYHFGDHDPSGRAIDSNILKKLKQYAPNTPIQFQRMAVTETQIKQYDLMTRPTKQTDSRAKNFEGGSVEVDALPPSVLKEMVRLCIDQHLDHYQYSQMKNAEWMERDTLSSFRNRWQLENN